MSEKKEVKIAAAKGRPMLTWVGKRPLRHVNAFPAQRVATFDPSGELVQNKLDASWEGWPEYYPKGGLLFHGDNKEVLAHLLANGFRGKVNLIYIDPPFDSGADYVRKVQLRGVTGTAKIDGETYTLGEQIQYTDIWANDNYLQFMYERLLLLKELLAENGLIFIHMDESRGHYIKILLDEIFNQENYINEIIWKRQTAHSDIGQGSKHLGRLHDSIFIYCKGSSYKWNNVYTRYSNEYIENFYKYYDPETGRRYRLSDITAPGGRSKGNPYYEFLGVTRYWRFSKERMDKLFKEGRIIQTNSGGVPSQKRYLDEMPGVPLQDIWDDIKPIQSQALERVDYPTQKSMKLIERIIEIGSEPCDLVLDCFIGSGTTAAVAQKLGRRWIGCDINKGAIQTTAKRLQSIINEQVQEAHKPQQTEFSEMADEDKKPEPAQLAFTNWRVNDYDLAIQHNEAVNLACEHIGVQRTRSDGFFDGILGKKLVKIIPFSHPLTPLDLEEIKKELEARPEEDRSIVVICLGKELVADAWLEDWNRLRKGKDAVNRVDVIELRTDPKYGNFIVHQPATAKVNIQRAGDKIKVEIKDFISPTIVERLEMDTPLFKAKITDWRSMVDYVMIDTAYNGQVFSVDLVDVPEKKSDLVSGVYELPAPQKVTIIAVNIVDMLGEEVLITKRL
ncbi:Modification methylase MboII [Pelotomaculum schinkii]|uniref:Modification methylase MboII n=1 Tax=Pelotomaculum schinkii TaxID=78350 RepID=A0A4Y7RCE9_9FIRM|nr:site-specific DNA-methyltransferase [Pelotomaculum schinkii]TEB06502.1 Modification methylase MboII [Pelotomaculum schinkii]